MVHNKIIKHLEIALKRAEELAEENSKKGVYTTEEAKKLNLLGFLIEGALQTGENWQLLLGKINDVLGEEREGIKGTGAEEDINNVTNHVDEMIASVSTLNRNLSSLSGELDKIEEKINEVDNAKLDELIKKFRGHIDQVRDELNKLSNIDEKIKGKLNEAFGKAKKKLIDDKKKGLITRKDSVLPRFLEEVEEIEKKLD